jgi:hypothetical protein
MVKPHCAPGGYDFIIWQTLPDFKSPSLPQQKTLLPG